MTRKNLAATPQGTPPIKDEMSDTNNSNANSNGNGSGNPMDIDPAMVYGSDSTFTMPLPSRAYQAGIGPGLSYNQLRRKYDNEGYVNEQRRLYDNEGYVNEQHRIYIEQLGRQRAALGLPPLPNAADPLPNPQTTNAMSLLGLSRAELEDLVKYNMSFAVFTEKMQQAKANACGAGRLGGQGEGKTEPEAPEKYSKPFCDFLTENPTIFHAVKYFEGKLGKAGFEELSERESWTDKVKAGGKYYLTRNGSGLIAFQIGSEYKSGDGVAMIAGHIDALTAKLKPVSKKDTKAGYVQLGVAQYGGALNETWWDRDLGVGGRILVKGQDGKVKSQVVKLDWPVAKIPTLAPHFGVGIMGTNNPETQAVPIIGVDNSDLNLSQASHVTISPPLLSGSFAATQPPALLAAIAHAAGVEAASIVNWELELFDTMPAQLIGLKKDLLSGGRIDDKLCSWAAIEALLCAPKPSKHIDLVALFDDEEIGSLLRQGARGNFLPSTVERISEVFRGNARERDALQRTYANSFLVSADVSHAVNPNFLDKYLENHAPRLNVGVVVSADSNGHMTTDAVSTAIMQRSAELSGSELQVFQIRNDSRSGGTVGPMLSSAMGCRAIDVGIPQLSMHSVRATTGSLDPGLGVKLFHGVFKNFEKVIGEFDF